MLDRRTLLLSSAAMVAAGSTSSALATTGSKFDPELIEAIHAGFDEAFQKNEHAGLFGDMYFPEHATFAMRDTFRPMWNRSVNSRTPLKATAVTQGIRHLCCELKSKMREYDAANVICLSDRERIQQDWVSEHQFVFERGNRLGACLSRGNDVWCVSMAYSLSPA